MAAWPRSVVMAQTAAGPAGISDADWCSSIVSTALSSSVDAGTAAPPTLTARIMFPKPSVTTRGRVTGETGAQRPRSATDCTWRSRDTTMRCDCFWDVCASRGELCDMSNREATSVEDRPFKKVVRARGSVMEVLPIPKARAETASACPRDGRLDGSQSRGSMCFRRPRRTEMAGDASECPGAGAT